MEEKILYQFRESWILFIVAAAILALFSYTPNWHYTLPIGIFLAYLVIRPFRIIKVHEDHLEVERPIAFQKFRIDFKNITRIRHQPTALKNPAGIIFYYKGETKENKLGFPKSLGSPLEKIILNAMPEIKIIEGFDD